MIAGIMDRVHLPDVTVYTDDPRCANSLGYLSRGAGELLDVYYVVGPGGALTIGVIS
jgi:hypothetical protein